jgi:Ham1 family
MQVHHEIRFVSSNPHKIAEAKQILRAQRIDVVASEIKIEEIQTKDTLSLVHDKVLKAFSRIGRPLFVEHTGLYLLPTSEGRSNHDRAASSSCPKSPSNFVCQSRSFETAWVAFLE